MALSPPPVDLYAYSPPVSLWGLVQAHVQGSEQDELKNMLGDSLVEQSLELRQEIEMLLEIWRDYREETQHLACNKLPEPPQMRDRLVQEIHFYITSIRDRAVENGQDADDMLSHHNRKILHYVMGDEGVSSPRPSSARSSIDGRETPMRRNGHNTPGSDGMSLNSSLSEEVESMNEKLNILKVDEVVYHLRLTLEEEVQQLLGDIRFLQGCLEDEAEFRSDPRMDSNPSIADLREERSKLEYELLNSDSLPFMPDVRRDSFSPTQQSRHMAKPLHAIQQKSLGDMVHPTSHPGPLRASHSIDINQGGKRYVPIEGRGQPSHPPSSHVAGFRVEPPKHVTLRTGSSARTPRRVQVVTVPTQPHPVPPTSAKPTNGRPSSATRFRRMVVDARGGT